MGLVFVCVSEPACILEDRQQVQEQDNKVLPCKQGRRRPATDNRQGRQERTQQVEFEGDRSFARNIYDTQNGIQTKNQNLKSQEMQQKFDSTCVNPPAEDQTTSSAAGLYARSSAESSHTLNSEKMRKIFRHLFRALLKPTELFCCEKQPFYNLH